MKSPVACHINPMGFNPEDESLIKATREHKENDTQLITLRKTLKNFVAFFIFSLHPHSFPLSYSYAAAFS